MVSRAASQAGALAQASAGAVARVPLSVVQGIGELPNPLTSRSRRTWETPGGVQIAVRHLGALGTARAARELEARLYAEPGVTRAEVNGVLGCVYVACDLAKADLESLVALVDQADSAAEGASAPPDTGAGAPARKAPPPRPAARTVRFPGAPDEELAAAVRVCLAALGTGTALAGRAAHLPGLHPITPTLVQLTQASPRLWDAVTRRLGTRTAERVWSTANLAASTFTFLPLGPLIATVQAAGTYAETRARRRAWQDWAERLARRGGTYRHDAAPVDERPAPLPPGPGERYSRVAVPAAIAAYAGTAAVTRDHNRALSLLVAGTPRAARAGRQAYASSVGRLVAGRGGLVLRPEALHRLDRIDTVVLDARVLTTGSWLIDEVAPFESEPDGVHEILARIHELIDGAEPGRPREHDGWSVRGFDGDADLPTDAADRVAAWTGRGMRVLLISRDGTPVAVAGVVPELHPLAEPLVRAARDCGRVVLAGGPPGLHRRLDLEEAAPVGSARTLALVRELQADGRGVALVGTRSGRALAGADLGIGVAAGSGRPPWDADVAGTREITHLLLTSVARARELGRLCGRAEVTGAALGAGAMLITRGPGALARARLVADAVTLTGIGMGAWSGRTLRARPGPAAVGETPWHSMTVRQVVGRLGTSAKGLDESEAARRMELAGGAAESGALSLADRIAAELANPLTPVLAAGGAISAALGSVVDAVLINGVLGVNALVGGVQRLDADRAAQRLTEATTSRVRLRRAGRRAETSAEQLVPGDVIELTAGDAVPADCRVIQAQGLQVDESSLTGESQSVAKSPRPTAAPEVAERHSMVYQGTTVAAGDARAVVVATGASTEAGSAEQAVPEGAPAVTGVERRLEELGRWFLPVSLVSGAVLFATELVRGRSLGAALAPAVSLCVAAVPEGLPFVATVAELSAARRLSTRNTLVRSPATIEALGRADVLCFDKTGTLTEGRISLQQVSDGRQRRPLDSLTPALRRVVSAAVLAGPPGAADTLAHPTDRAITGAAEHLDLAAHPDTGEYHEYADGWRRLSELPFEPGRGFHAVLGRGDGQTRLVVKGAPEVVLARCAGVRRDGAEVPFDDALREEIHREIDRLAQGGLRVLAVADREATGPLADGTAELAEDSVEDLCLLGLLGLADPVRATAAQSVGRLAEAGVRIVMITGDHPSTAAAIAGELQPHDELRMMTGPELDALDDEALAEVLPRIAVFARATPAHKVRIVAALRAAGRIVAVTGDGANDAPAIRIADVGIAIGARATPAARTAADVVVTDDRIETIVDAIVEGRSMWASVRKALGILLGGNLGEIAFTLASSLLTGRSALNARQLLLVNLLTDMLPAMAIAARPPAGSAEKLLAEGPEASLGTALTRHIRLRAVLTASAAGGAWLAARATGTRSRADSVALVALVASQLLQTMVDAGRDPVVAVSAVGSLLALFLVVSVPGLSHFFGSRPIGPGGWAIATAAAVGSVLLSLMARGVLSPPARRGTAAA